MVINDKVLNSIRDLSSKIDEQEKLASELLRIAQDRFGETKLTVERKKGDKKFVQAKQKDLWREVYELGMQSEAGDALRKKHPKVFEAYEKLEKLKTKLNSIAVMDLGLQSHSRITLRDIVNLADAISEWKVKKLVKEDSLDSTEVSVDNNKK